MAYDDTPYWQKFGSKDVSEPVKPKPTTWSGIQKSALMPSPLFSWHVRESGKRSQGVYNEIDLNEILMALKGVKNRWFKRVQANVKQFTDFASKPTADEFAKLSTCV